MPDQFLNEEQQAAIASVTEIPNTPQQTSPEITPVGRLEEDRLRGSGLQPALVDLLKKDRQSIVDEQLFDKDLEGFEESTQDTFDSEQQQLANAAELQDFEDVDVLSMWDADTLAKDEEFSLESYISENPESIHDERSTKLREIWRKTNMEPITAQDVAIGTAKLPWTTAKTIYKFAKGTGQILVDVFGAPVAGLAGDLTGQGPEFQTALRELNEKELSEDLAGLEQGTFGFAQFIERTRRNLPRRIGFSNWEDIPDQQLQEEFANHFEGYLQNLRIGEGKGEFQQAIGGEILKGVEARGDVLDPERVANVAEADPIGFFMFGKAFQAGGAAIGQTGKALGKTKPVKAARDLNATRKSLEKIRNTIPPGEPVRQLADDLLKAASERTGTGAKALERVFQVGDAATRLVEAGAKVRTLENAAKAFATPGRQAALAEARTALAAAEQNAAGHIGARGVAGMKKLFSTVDAQASGQQIAGRVAQGADIGLRATARTIEALPGVATAGAVGGALITGNVVGALATLGGAGLLRGVLKRSATGLAKPFRKAAGVADAGRAAVTATGGTPFQRALQGVARGSGEIVGEALKATPIDIGFGLALAESPDDVQNISGYAAAFRALHATGRPLSRFVQAVKAGQQRSASQFLPRKAGNIGTAEAANRNNRQLLSPEQRARVESVESFLKETGSETPIYVMDQPAFLAELTTQFERKNGRAPNATELADLKNFSEQRGMFAEEVIGDNGETGGAIFVTSPEAISHEGAHPFQNVLGERGNQFVDQIVFDEFTGQWEQIGADYVSRLEGQAPRAAWRDALQSIIPERIRQEAGGDPIKAADIFMAREIGAEQFSVLFDATGGRPTAKTSLTEKLATVVDRTASFFGHNIMESGPTTPGLGLEVSGRATDAIRQASQSQARRAGADGQPARIIPGEAGAPAPTPTPARPTPGSPQPGVPRTPVQPTTPTAPTSPAASVRPAARPIDPLRADTRESLNIGLAREKAAQSGDQNVIDNVEAIGGALQRSPGEAVVINAENLSVIPGKKGSAFERTLRRAEQAVPEAAREFFSKRFAITRFLSDKFSGNKLQVAAMSMDKVLSNVFNLNERLNKKNSTDLVPYETDATGQFTESGWQSFTSDLISYTSNQANGYRGSGEALVRPDAAIQELGIAVPEVNPTYNPVRLPATVEQYMNVVQAIPTPRTAREFRGIVPGNVKGQVLREAQGERTFDPLDITPRNVGKTFKSFPERTVQETNPLRQQMVERGVNTRELLEVVERLNLDRLQNVQVEPDLRFNLPSTDIIRAGFLPREAKGDVVELFRGQPGGGAAAGTFFTQNQRKAASFAPDGKVFRIEVPRAEALEAKRAAEATGQGGDTFLLKPGADRGAVEVKSETPTFQLLPAEFKSGETIDLKSVRDMSPEQFKTTVEGFQGELGGGLTGMAFEAGSQVRTSAEVQALRDLYTQIQADTVSAREAKNIDSMFDLVNKGQFVREALEAATGEGGSESFIQRRNPDFVSPAKEAAAEGRQFQPVEKAGGKEDAAAKAWREKDVESPFFKKWFDKSKVVDESGQPKLVSHGTTQEFDTFDTNRGNVESDFGKGIYFTDSKADVGFNYASKPSEGLGGTSPDLQGKVERRAEFLEQEREISFEEAKVIAESELVGPVEREIEAYVKMENPIVIGEEVRVDGAPKETVLEFREERDEAGDFTGEAEGLLLEFNDALRNNSFRADVENIIGSYMEKAFDGEGIRASELVKSIKEHEDALEVTNENGELASGEMIREAFEDIGFDGIIDRSVSEKFPNMQGIEDATHYIAFQPTQVKGVKNTGEFDPSNPKFQALPKGEIDIKRRVGGFDVAFTGRDGVEVGKLQIDKTGPEQATVKAVDVEEGFQRQGIGEGLYQAAREELISQGITKLTGAVEGSGPIQLREKVFGAGKTRLSDGGEDLSVAEGRKIVDEDFGRLIAESILPKAERRVEGQDEFQFLPKEEVTAEQIRIANKTARGGGAVGGKLTRTARAVSERVDPSASVLDFGAGPKAVQSQNLRDLGFTDIKAHEFGDNIVEGVHTANALGTQHDAVFASNVLNVQSSVPMLQDTLSQIASATKGSGKAIFNYPKSPRKMEQPLTADELRANIQDHFTNVERVGGTASEPVFEATGPRRNKGVSLLPPERPLISTPDWKALPHEGRVAHFPEAIVTKPKGFDEKGNEIHEKIPYDILGSPRAEKFKQRTKVEGKTPSGKPKKDKVIFDEEAAINDFAKPLMDKYLERVNEPESNAGKQWYEDFFPLLRAHYKGDAQIMAEMLAATSPNTPPKTNFFFADQALKRWKAGEFDEIISKYEEGLEGVASGDLLTQYKSEVPVEVQPKTISPATLMSWWINKHDLLPTQRTRLDSKGEPETKKFGFHGKAILKVVTRRWMQENAGPKTENFVSNLTGEGIEATVDVWAVRSMRDIAYKGFQDRWRLLPVNEAAVTNPDFFFSQKVFKRAADNLGILPRQLQGALWFGEKVNWFEQGWGKLDLGDYKTELEATIRRERDEKKEAEEAPEPTDEELRIVPR